MKEEKRKNEEGYLGCVSCFKPVSDCKCKLRVIAEIMKKDPNKIYYEPILRY